MDPRRPLDRHRVFLAFVTTPLLVSFYTAVWFAQPWALPYGLLVAYPSAALLGLPMLVLLQRLGHTHGAYFAAGGALCALPAVWLESSPLRPPQLEALDTGNGLYLILAGALAGLLFWLLGIAGESSLRWRKLLDLGPPD